MNREVSSSHIHRRKPLEPPDPTPATHVQAMHRRLQRGPLPLLPYANSRSSKHPRTHNLPSTSSPGARGAAAPTLESLHSVSRIPRVHTLGPHGPNPAVHIHILLHFCLNRAEKSNDFFNYNSNSRSHSQLMLEISNKSLASATVLAEHHLQSGWTEVGQGRERQRGRQGCRAWGSEGKRRRRDGAEGRGRAVAPPPRALGAWLPKDVPV